jgi:hypothetical protein
MEMFYSAKMAGFFAREIHGDNMPDDVVEISAEDHVALLAAQSEGFSIVAGKDGVPVISPRVPPSIDQLRANAKGEMVAWIDRLTEQLRADIPRDEIASWPAKSAEARAFLANGTAAPILQVEADMVGLTLTEVAETIVARAALYEAVVGAVAGIRRNTAAAIDAATDAEGVASALDEALATASAKATELGLVVAV